MSFIYKNVQNDFTLPGSNSCCDVQCPITLTYPVIEIGCCHTDNVLDTVGLMLTRDSVLPVEL